MEAFNQETMNNYIHKLLDICIKERLSYEFVNIIDFNHILIKYNNVSIYKTLVSECNYDMNSDLFTPIWLVIEELENK